jgi:hypothetical protein
VIFLGRKNLDGRHRRLVRSWSHPDSRNPAAMSRYIENENAMTADERKNTELPCGYTVAQSWCALRSSWVGFNIAHSKGDQDKMKYYALFIRKVQSEMGIDVTKFDPEILGETDQGTESEDQGDSQGHTQEGDEVQDEPNYDDILGEIQTKLKVEYTSCPGPREQIFVKDHEKGEKVDNRLQKGSHSGDFVIIKEPRPTGVSWPGHTKELRPKSQSDKFAIPDEEEGQDAAEVKRNSCTYEVEDEDEEYEDQQEVKRNSCTYEIK